MINFIYPFIACQFIIFSGLGFLWLQFKAETALAEPNFLTTPRSGKNFIALKTMNGLKPLGSFKIYLN